MRWSYLGAAGALFALPWACGGKSVIDGQAVTGGGGSGNTTNTGGSNTGGSNTGGSTPVGPAGPVTVSVGPMPPVCQIPSLSGECNDCLFNFCQFDLVQCCQAVGCVDLVSCVADFCTGAADQQACAIQNCPDEVSQAASAGTLEQAQSLGSCVSSCGCG